MKIRSRLLALTVALLTGLSLLAIEPVHASLAHPQRIDDAISAYLTRKGQRFFENNLEDIFFLNGYAFHVGQYERWDYAAKEEIDLNHLPGKFQAHQATFNRVRSIMREWLVGFTLNNPLFELGIDNIQWALQFDRFAITSDFDRLRETGATNAAVFVFEAVIPEMRIDVQSIMGRDLHNDFLGDIGLRRFFAEFGPTGTPLRVRVPVLFSINNRGGLRAEVLAVESNLEGVAVTSGFGEVAEDCRTTPRRERAAREDCQSWLKLPAMGVRIGTRYMPLNTRNVERKLLRQKDDLIKSLQTYLDEYAADNSPAKLNAFIEERMPRGFFDVSEMVPPGAPDNLPPGRKFRWELHPRALQHERNYVRVGLSGWVEDPSPTTTVPNLRLTTRGATPRVNASRFDTNDIVLALSQDFVNRIVQQSWLRGYLREFAVSGSNPIRLIEPPVLVIDGLSAGNQGTLKLNVETEVDGLGSALVRNPLRMKLDLRVRLGRTDKGGLKIAMDRVLLNSIVLDQSRITWSWNYFAARVMIATKNKFRAFNQKIARDETLLVPSCKPAVAGRRCEPEEFKVLDKMFGIPLDLQDVGSDGNGHILFFMNFGSELG